VAPPNSGWSNWELLMPMNVPQAVAFQGFPVAVNNQTDFQELQVCTVASDGGLWTINQANPLGTGWNPWRFLSSPKSAGLYPLQSPVVAVTNSGLNVFVSGGDGNVWSISQASPGGPWGAFIGLAG